jgi:hypothetical protein
MTFPPFGFSPSDFAAAICLIRKIWIALEDAGGASAEFQHLLRELQGLQIVLEQLRDLPASSSSSQSHYNAIRGMSYDIQVPLRAFVEKMGPYHDKLGVDCDKSFWRTAGRKIKWALTMQDEVSEMRRVINMRITTVSLLLSLPIG